MFGEVIKHNGRHAEGETWQEMVDKAQLKRDESISVWNADKEAYDRYDEEMLVDYYNSKNQKEQFNNVLRDNLEVGDEVRYDNHPFGKNITGVVIHGEQIKVTGEWELLFQNQNVNKVVSFEDVENIRKVE